MLQNAKIEGKSMRSCGCPRSCCANSRLQVKFHAGSSPGWTAVHQHIQKTRHFHPPIETKALLCETRASSSAAAHYRRPLPDKETRSRQAGHPAQLALYCPPLADARSLTHHERCGSVRRTASPPVGVAFPKTLA